MDYQIVEQQVQKYKHYLSQAADTIRSEDVSLYPILVMSEMPLAIGIPIFERDENQTWNIHASTLEEFYVKKMIGSDKIDDFRKAYQSPETHLCIFFIDSEIANFIFVQR